MVYYTDLMLPLYVSVVKPPSSGRYHTLQLLYSAKPWAMSYVTSLKFSDSVYKSTRYNVCDSVPFLVLDSFKQDTVLNSIYS
jgi:hypothetical protein